MPITRLIGTNITKAINYSYNQKSCQENNSQYQVVLKPSPDNIQELYLDSLRELGVDPLVHDIRFVEDNWERIDREAFADDHKRLFPAAQAPTSSEFNRWLQLAKDYYKLTEEPRGSRQEWTEKIRAVAEDIESLREFDSDSADKFSGYVHF